MSPATILTIIEIIGALIKIAKDAPAVIEEAKSLRAKIAPHVDSAGDDIRRAFQDVQAQLA